MLDFDNIYYTNPLLHKFTNDSEKRWTLADLRDHRIECGCSLREAIEHMGTMYETPGWETLWKQYVRLYDKFEASVRQYNTREGELMYMLDEVRNDYRDMRDRYEALSDEVSGFPQVECPACGLKMRNIKADGGKYVCGQVHVINDEAYICTNYECYDDSYEEED